MVIYKAALSQPRYLVYNVGLGLEEYRYKALKLIRHVWAADSRHCLSLPKAQPGERVTQCGYVLIRFPGVGGDLLVGDAAEHAGFVR